MEYIDIVNGEDIVLGSATLPEIYAKKHLHRIVHIFVVNERGDIALQLRSREKSFCPLHWSTSVGGHVQAGEDYVDAARREMQEELGIAAELSWMGKDWYAKEDGLNKFFGTFRAVHPGPFAPNPREVADVRFFSFADIRTMAARGEKMNPELLFLLRRYFF